ncbi:hypothetical protein B0J17DRAFT_705408 [Rhizoctonia solani]|nr:hypothetical protein B0J17DRAFT_705408 [Rhizoctonia solani]
MPVSSIVNKHLQYTYDNGWEYQFWLKSPTRIVYCEQGGPMAGRFNYQHCHIQEVRIDEVFQISWVEETDTIVSLVVDLRLKRLTTFMVFSYGHWNCSQQAHGDKRNLGDLERWRGLATQEAGLPIKRHVIPEQATIDRIFDGPGDLEDIDDTAPTL